MLSKIKVAPGINRDTTNYSNSGGWFDSDYIRFRNGLPEKIGGWTKVYADQTALIGECRKLYDWSTLVGTSMLALPTNIKFYVDNSSEIIDITPLRRELLLSNNPFTSTISNSTVIVTDVNHGAVIGDYVTFSGATAFNSLTTDMLNAEFQVDSVVNSNAYTIIVSGNASASGDGGGSTVTASYQIHGGISGIPALSGWGSGPWGGVSGSYGWGEGPNSTLTTYYSGLWSVDNYGEDMVACPRDLSLYTVLGTTPLALSNGSNVVTVTSVNHGLTDGTAVIIGNIVNEPLGGIPASEIAGTHWISVVNANAFTYTVTTNATSTTNVSTNAVVYTSALMYWDITDSNGPAISFSQMSNAYAKLYLPYVATEIMVSDQNRQVIAFGCNPYDTLQGQDKMVVRWSDSSDPTNWDAADVTTTAGEQRLSSGSFIVTALQNREEILIWTDSSLFTMSYIGPPYVYGFNLVGSNFDIIGPNSKAIAGSIAYWMGTNNFYMYSGKIEPMPCTVRDYVFTDISIEDGDKVYCSTDTGNNEIIWFYPSESQGGDSGTREVDRYVVFNYLEQVWYYGSLSRTAWIDRRGHTNPRAVSVDGYLYNQESGFDDGSTTPALPIPAYIESSPIEIDEGHNFLFITRVVPDLTFRDSTTHDGDVEPSVMFTIKPQDYPGSEIGIGDERTVTRSNAATLKVNRFTNQVFTRLRARSVILRVESDETGVQWRLGTPRFDLRQDGRR